jgi:hypothetical protein
MEELALVRFGVYVEDPFSDARLIATSVAPLKYVRQGMRRACITPKLVSQ